MPDEAAKLDEAVRLMNDVRVTVAKIETRLEEHVSRQEERTKNRDDAQSKIVDRVAVLEKFRWQLIAVSGLAGGTAGKLAGLL